MTRSWTAYVPRLQLRDLRDGDHIGTEGDLERRLGISRNIVREAVARLRALGVVRSLRGKGLIVTKPDPAKLLEKGFSFFSPDQVDLVALAELRFVLEAGAIELAAARATDEQIARLIALGKQDAAFAEHAPLNRNDFEKSQEITKEFHLLLIEACGSPLAQSLSEVVHTYFTRVLKEMPDYHTLPPGISAGLLGEHLKLAEAIQARDGKRAHTIICCMMTRLIRRLRHLPDEGPIPSAEKPEKACVRPNGNLVST